MTAFTDRRWTPAERAEAIAYRNSLPQGLRRLEAILATESGWRAEVVAAEIEAVRGHNRARNRARRMKEAHHA